MKALIVIICVCVGLTNALAQTQKKKADETKKTINNWKLEPQSFLSIKLGVPITESLDKCSSDLRHEEKLKKMCWTGSNDSKSKLGIFIAPDIGVWYTGHEIEVIDGLVESVAFGFKHFEYVKVADLLKSKYGPPTTRKVAEVKTRGGASYDSLEMTWKGKKYTLTYKSISGTIDEGWVQIYSPKYLKAIQFKTDKYMDKL
jgi:hypothetical protein